MVAAIILAAGKSERMGRSKMDLPWGKKTVIGQVVTTLASAGVDEIIVVTGGASENVETALRLLPSEISVRTAYNPRYLDGGMIFSVKCGLRTINNKNQAALIALGDQPQMEVDVVRSILADFNATSAQLIVPSYRKRRGHPWLVGRSLWTNLLKLREAETLRDFLNKYSDQIHYLMVNTPTVLQDLDTPADYQYFHK